MQPTDLEARKNILVEHFEKLSRQKEELTAEQHRIQGEVRLIDTLIDEQKEVIADTEPVDDTIILE